MTKTNLAVIDRSINDALEGAKSPEAILPPNRNFRQTMTVAGFEVTDLEFQTQVRNKYIDEITSYQNKRLVVIEKLAAEGIKPLAVVPQRVWDRMCKDTGLLQLRMDGKKAKGKDMDLIHDMAKERGQFISQAIPFIGSAIGAGIAYVFFKDCAEITPVGHFALPAIIGLVTGVVTKGIDVVGEFSDKFSIRFFGKRLLKETAVLQQIFNHASSWDKSYGIRLPTPPDDVQAVLAKIGRSKIIDQMKGDGGMRVAAEIDAVTFNPPLYDTMLNRYREIEIEKTAARRDPIIYLNHDGLSVIFAQFGDFPIEQALVEDLCTGNHNLL
jgi:hypothetical protein